MFYFVFPEIAGGLGPETILDHSTSPPFVRVLNYEFDGWLGDDLLESFPCFIITERLKSKLNKATLTGFKFSNIIVSKSDVFKELYPDKELPEFYWLQVYEKVKHADFSITDKGELVVSSQAMYFLSGFNLSHAVIQPYE